MLFGEKFRKKYALTEAGEANVKKGVFWTAVTNLLVIAGISFLYLLMQGFMATLTGGTPLPAALPYIAGVIAFVALSYLTHYQQYHYTYSVVYDEVGAVRTNLAERLRKLPLSFFARRDLAELTETMMGDVDRLEHVWSHVLGYLYGSYISTAVVAVMVLAYDWRLAIACLWGVPVAFALLFGSRKIFDSYGRRAKKAALAVADDIQETLMGDFSMVFQDVTLFDDTVMENIRLGRRGASDEEVLAAAAAANCDEFVSRLAEGYATPIGENGARLSGGERQRISIARALLKDAPIVLLDEATASLDIENETKVQAALSRLLAGKTVLVIAHRMRTVMGADKIVVLDDGRVVEQGAPAELRAAGGTFARMVELQGASASWSV